MTKHFRITVELIENLPDKNEPDRLVPTVTTSIVENIVSNTETYEYVRHWIIETILTLRRQAIFNKVNSINKPTTSKPSS